MQFIYVMILLGIRNKIKLIKDIIEPFHLQQWQGSKATIISAYMAIA